MIWTVRRVRVLLLTAAVAAPASAQVLPSAPIAFADGHVTIGADVSASVGPAESGTGYFNYTDYDHSTLRLLRIDVTASARLNDHFTILADVRTENGDVPVPYGLYVRIRPWTGRNFDLQVGRVPPTFGAFPRRIYAADNPLIGYPLAYQYLTSLRADALPASADELLRMRGRGWRTSYSVGNPIGAAGLPLASAFRWDTGIQAHGGTDVIDVTGSVTNGSPSNPLVRDDNSGKQFAGRVAYHPSAGLLIGASVARAPFVARSALASLPGVDPGSAAQRAIGADLEYSRGYYLVRFETVISDWTLPTIASPLRAIGSYVEGRYKVQPGLYVAARLDHLTFNDVTGTSVRTTWDAPVTRLEVGGGYYIQRNLLAKVSFQHDARAAGHRESSLAAAQLVFWF